ncbi:hypothetical protein OIU84_000264 [Salix udensis]|uniref:Uncharacterized protein n=1 Tax=Salix udensis TaxID=889485 RepID=A0AAD6PM47_9ROSI|nr:hypothetical protein OIU84_000264 [Salix udensis]
MLMQVSAAMRQWRKKSPRWGGGASALNSKSTSHASRHAFSQENENLASFLLLPSDQYRSSTKNLERTALCERDRWISWFYDPPSLCHGLCYLSEKYAHADIQGKDR